MFLIGSSQWKINAPAGKYVQHGDAADYRKD